MTVGGFLVGYGTTSTREAYARDLGQWGVRPTTSGSSRSVGPASSDLAVEQLAELQQQE